MPTIQPNSRPAIPDIAALAVQARNVQAGIMAPTTPTAGPTERPPAVTIDARTAELAEQVAEAVEDSGAAPARPRLSAARQEMLASVTQSYADYVKRQGYDKETVRLYEETGKVYSVQPSGSYEYTEKGLEPFGGAEGYINMTKARLAKTPAILAHTAQRIAEWGSGA